jgi:RNase H-fold protein (predicted Holliday junction resolvase)
MKSSTDIVIGTPVSFDSDHGPQRGTVHSFKSDLSNGRRVAMVKVQGTLNGEPWAMPVEQLQCATATA